VYAASRDRRQPKHVGSCILLDIDGTPVVSTAAHVIDDIKTAEMFIAGLAGTQWVQITGGSIKTTPDRGSVRRQLDHFDCAFWTPPESAVAALGPVEFLKSERISHNRVPVADRLYTAIGYPVSRNKDRINYVARQLSTGISMYTGTVEAMPALAASLGVSGREHLFMRFGKHAFTANGQQINPFGPIGLSGGALLDLGDFAAPDVYARDPQRRALLSGMLIEHDKRHRALIAVKIGLILNGIRLALAQRTSPLRAGSSAARHA